MGQKDAYVGREALGGRAENPLAAFGGGAEEEEGEACEGAMAQQQPQPDPLISLPSFKPPSNAAAAPVEMFRSRFSMPSSSSSSSSSAAAPPSPPAAAKQKKESVSRRSSQQQQLEREQDEVLCDMSASLARLQDCSKSLDEELSEQNCILEDSSKETEKSEKSGGGLLGSIMGMFSKKKSRSTSPSPAAAPPAASSSSSLSASSVAGGAGGSARKKSLSPAAPRGPAPAPAPAPAAAPVQHAPAAPAPRSSLSSSASAAVAPASPASASDLFAPAPAVDLPPVSLSLEACFQRLLQSQCADGSWALDAAFVQLLGAHSTHVAQAGQKAWIASARLSSLRDLAAKLGLSPSALATLLALWLFDTVHGSRAAETKMMLGKSKNALRSKLGVPIEQIAASTNSILSSTL